MQMVLFVCSLLLFGNVRCYISDWKRKSGLTYSKICVRWVVSHVPVISVRSPYAIVYLMVSAYARVSVLHGDQFPARLLPTLPVPQQLATLLRLHPLSQWMTYTQLCVISQCCIPSAPSLQQGTCKPGCSLLMLGEANLWRDLHLVIDERNHLCVVQ